MATTTSSLTGLGLSGLSSGLDTSGIITKLMAIEAQPQTALKTRLTGATQFRNALQAVNSAVAAIATTATAATKSGALAAVTAKSDTDGVTVTASSSSSAGSLAFTVGAIAKPQVSVSAALTAWPDSSASRPAITIATGSGTTRTVEAASTNLDDVVEAINGAATGVTATKIAAGTDPDSGKPQYLLQLRGATGAGNSFTLYQGSDTSAPELQTTRVSTAQDASITLYGGSAAERTVTSSTNTFDDLMTGVDVTVSAVTSKEATVTVAADATAATASAKALTSGLIALFSGIASATAIASTTGSSGTTSTSGGTLTGDSQVRSLKDTLLAKVSAPVDGASPSTIGIEITRDGTITFDADRFAAAMAKDPTGTTAMFQTVAGRIGQVATAASDPYTGSLTTRITSQQTTESTLSKEITDWDARLAVIQAQYTKQFNALETALSSLSSQSSYLTSQIAGLTTNYQS